MTTLQLMNRHTMKLNTFLFSGILIILSTCNGQNNNQATNTEVLNERIAKGDTVKELGLNIMLIYQDRKNNYWFGSWEDGLYRYDGRIILHFTTKDGLPHNRINDIQEDKSGNIYVNTNKGISKFDGKNFTTLSVADSDNQWKLEPYDLWFKQTLDWGFVLRYDGKLLHRLTFPNTKHGDEYVATHPNSKYPNNQSSPYTVYSIYKDTKGNIWFGTAALGVCRYDGKNIEWISEEDVTELHDGPANGVRSIIEDKDGYFWFNT